MIHPMQCKIPNVCINTNKFNNVLKPNEKIGANAEKYRMRKKTFENKNRHENPYQEYHKQTDA